MNITPSRQTIRTVEKILKSSEHMGDKKLKKLLENLSISAISDIGLCYFGIDSNSIDISIQLSNESFSEAQMDKGLSIISKYNHLNGNYKIAQIIRDVIHESVHHCQFHFFKQLNQPLKNDYLEALKLNVMNDKYLYYNGIKNEIACQIYLPPSNKMLSNYLYAAQPIEAQAFNLTDKYYKSLSTLISKEYLIPFSVSSLNAKDKTPQEIDRVCRNNGIAAVHAQCSQMLLNLYRGAEFSVHKKIQDIYKELIQGQVREQINFLGIKELYPPTEKDLDTNFSDLISQNQSVDFGMLREQWKTTIENFNLNIMVTQNSNMLQDYIIFGASYKMSQSDYDSFMFAIGEKPVEEFIINKFNNQVELEDQDIDINN